MQKNILRKRLAIGIAFLFIGTCVASNNMNVNGKDSSSGSGLNPVITGVSNSIISEDWIETQILFPSDCDNGDYFGCSVSIDGNTAIIGAYYNENNGVNSGSVYVFIRTGNNWTQQAKLSPSDYEPGMYFGRSVSLDGDTALIGAYCDCDLGPCSGSAYIFIRTDNIWTQQIKLLAYDGEAYGNFGFSVDLDGDNAAIGARGGQSVYIYTRSGTIWTLQEKLLSPNAPSMDSFGCSVSIDGNTALIGASEYCHNGILYCGSAYVFTREETTWNLQQELFDSNGVDNDRFGYSVSLSGDTALIGIPNKNGDGEAFIFTRNNTMWTLKQFLIYPYYPPLNRGGQFGLTVSLSGDTALIGAPSHIPCGVVCVFARIGNTWFSTQKLIPSDYMHQPNDAYFGTSISINNCNVLIGEYQGNLEVQGKVGLAYLFYNNDCPTPTANFYWSPQLPAPEVNQTILFSGSSSYDLDGYIELYQWDWNNDGIFEESSSDPTITHSWSNAGKYPVKLKVIDNSNLTNNITHIVKVANNNLPPIRPIKPSGPSNGYAGDLISYSTTSSDSQGDEIRYGWDWNSDLNVDGWTNYFPSGSIANVDLSWYSKGNYYLSVIAEDEYGAQSSFSEPLLVTIRESHPPNKPSKPSGPQNGLSDVVYSYTTSSTDPDEDKISYAWDWNGDDIIDGWTKFYSSGAQVTRSHSWTAGSYQVQVKAMDIEGMISDWSDPLVVTISGNGKPIAYIDSISPIYTNQIDTISFIGHGEDSDGYIVEYRWESSLDGFLSNKSSFDKSGFSSGYHYISFWVKDNDGRWSNAVSYSLGPLHILKGNMFRPEDYNQPPYFDYEANDYSTWGLATAKSSVGKYVGAMGVGSSAWGGYCDAWAQIGSSFIITGKSITVKFSALIDLLSAKLNVPPAGFSSFDVWFYLWKEVGYEYQLIGSKKMNIIPTFGWDDFITEVLFFASLFTEGMLYIHNIWDMAGHMMLFTDAMNFFTALKCVPSDPYSINTDYYTLFPGKYYANIMLVTDAAGGIAGTGNIVGGGQLNYIAYSEQTNINHQITSTSSTDLMIEGHCKINISITDPVGHIIQNNYSDIPFANYFQADIDMDGQKNDVVSILNPLDGTYEIRVIADENVSSDDNYSILYTTDGINFVYLAENVSIFEIPTDPYIIHINSENPPLIQLDYPTGYQTLNGLKIFRWHAYDNEDGENLSVHLYYSDDSGENWYQINDGFENNTGVFFLDTTMIPDGEYYFKVETVDSDGNFRYDISEWCSINNRNGTSPDNQPPVKPSDISGKKRGKLGIEYIYSCNTTDNESDAIYYLFDWGDSSNYIIGPMESDEVVQACHSWSQKGTFEVRVRGIDVYGFKGDWSDPLSVTIPRSRAIDNPILMFFEDHPLLFKMFQLFFK